MSKPAASSPAPKSTSATPALASTGNSTPSTPSHSAPHATAKESGPRTPQTPSTSNTGGASSVPPLVKALTNVDHTEFSKDSLLAQQQQQATVSTPTLSIASAPLLGGNSNSNKNSPHSPATPSSPRRSDTSIEALGPLPNFSALKSTPKGRPTARPLPSRTGPHSHTLGRGGKDKSRLRNATLRSGTHAGTSHRRARSKSLPGFPSWLLTRRADKESHSTSSGFSSSPMLPANSLASQERGAADPVLEDLREAGIALKSVQSSTMTRSRSIYHDGDEDSDTDSDSDSSDSETESVSNSTKSHSRHVKTSSSNSNTASVLGSSSNTVPLDSPTDSSSSKSPGTARSTKKDEKKLEKEKSKDKKDKKQKEKEKAKEKSKSKDKHSSASPAAKQPTSTTPASPLSNDTSATTGTSTNVMTPTGAGKSSVGSTGGTRAGARSKPQFMTAFDWLKSYAAGQVELGEDESSSHEEESSKGTSEIVYPYSNTGTGSGDDEEYDEEELHLISDTDDVSPSVDLDILDSSSGTMIPTRLRRHVFKQFSSGISTSSSSTTAMSTTTTSYGGGAGGLLDSALESSSSSSTNTSSSSSNRHGKSTGLSGHTKSGSLVGGDTSSLLSGKRTAKKTELPPTSPTSPLSTKASKRKTERPITRHKEEATDGESSGSAANISPSQAAILPLDALSGNASQLAKRSKRASERNPRRDDPDSPVSISPPTRGADSVTATSLSFTTAQQASKPAKPKFSRAATVFEERPSAVSPPAASTGATNNQPSSTSTKLHKHGLDAPQQLIPFTRSPSPGTTSAKASAHGAPPRKPANSLSVPTGASGHAAGATAQDNSWKKSPEVVKLRKRSMRLNSVAIMNESVSKDTAKPLNNSGEADPATARSATGASESIRVALGANNRMVSSIQSPPIERKEFEENGIRIAKAVVPEGSTQTYPDVIVAISLEGLFEVCLENWSKERALREEFLSVMPFLAKPVEVIEALNRFWTRKVASLRNAAASTPSTASAPSLKKSRKTSVAIAAVGTPPTSPVTSPLPPDSVIALRGGDPLNSSGGLIDETVLQRRVTMFITDWVKMNFTYFTDINVLEALGRLLDKIASTNMTNYAPHSNVTASNVASANSAPASPAPTSKSAANQPSPGGSSASSTKLPTLRLNMVKQASDVGPSSLSSPAEGHAEGTTPQRWVERELLMRIIQYKLAGIDPRDLPGLVVRMKHPKFGLKFSHLHTARGSFYIFQGADVLKWLRKLQEENVDTPQASLFKRLQGKMDSFMDRNGGTSAPTSARSTGSSGSSSKEGAGSTSSAPHPLQRENSLANVLEIDSSEVMTQLLKEKLVTQVSSRSGKPREPQLDENGEPMIQKKKSYMFTIGEHVEMNARLNNLQPLTRTPSNSSSSDSQSTFLETQPDIFARQLAILESNLFQRIEPHEFHFWLKGDKARRSKAAPNLLRVISNMNRMTSWVSTEIVTTANPKQRISTLKRFILVAQYCLKYKNYQGLLEIMGGLSTTSVSRLSAWRELPDKYTNMHAKLAEIVNPGNNWKNYRPLIEVEQSACVPYVGLFLSDLTFVHDGVNSEIADGRLNWKKASRLAVIFTGLRKMQRRAYPFAPDFGIITYITDELITMDEKELFAQSKLLEPTRARSGSIV